MEPRLQSIARYPEQRQLTVFTAESCPAGLIASQLAEPPGHHYHQTAIQQATMKWRTWADDSHIVVPGWSFRKTFALQQWASEH